MPYEIEMDVPLPPKTKRGGKGLKYPFFDLPVGGSFLVPLDEDKSLWAAVGRFRAKNPHMAFRTHKTPEGVRVWRTV